jgi:hypothetical protein
MDTIVTQSSRQRGSFAALRQFVRERAPVERCELCSVALAPDHQHLIEPASRQLICSCDACAILFSDREDARYRRVPRRVQFLADFQMTDAQWDSLLIPISMAFFYTSTLQGKVVALYPSPAGATESLLDLESWADLVRDNPILAELEPDVEALLVNRVGSAREYYRVPIDECYKLVGLIRTNWRGLSGGAEVWEAIGRFFAGLRERSYA